MWGVAGSAHCSTLYMCPGASVPCLGREGVERRGGNMLCAPPPPPSPPQPQLPCHAPSYVVWMLKAASTSEAEAACRSPCVSAPSYMAMCVWGGVQVCVGGRVTNGLERRNGLCTQGPQGLLQPVRDWGVRVLSGELKHCGCRAHVPAPACVRLLMRSGSPR